MSDHNTLERTHHASPELRGRLSDQWEEARVTESRIIELMDLGDGDPLTRNTNWFREMDEIMYKLIYIYRYNNGITRDGGEARGVGGKPTEMTGPMLFAEIYVSRVRLQEYIKRIIMDTYQHMGYKNGEEKFEEAVTDTDATPLRSASPWVDGQERSPPVMRPDGGQMVHLGYNPVSGNLYGGSRKKKRKSKKRRSKKRKSRRGRRTKRR